MKYILSLLLSSIVFLSFTGCSLLTQIKRDIYQAVTDEIDDELTKGDRYYERGYYADAIKSYELVNYYEDRPVVSYIKIKSLKKSAKKYARIHYKRAMQIVHKNKIRALFEFNKMIRYDPDYKDGKEQFEKLKQDISVRKFLIKQEVALQNAMKANPKQGHYSRNLDDTYQKIISYDDHNPIALKANKFIQEQHILRIEKCITLFKNGEINQAKKQLLSIQSIDRNNRTVKKYLEKIEALNQEKRDKIDVRNQEKEDITEFKSLLQNAQIAYEAEEYSMALEYVKKALAIDKDNKDALQLMKEVNEDQQAMIPILLFQAENYYKEKKLREALNLFNKILLTNPDDNTSITYIRKIEHQLKTIESLK